MPVFNLQQAGCLTESMGEVTPVKLVVRAELCGIGAFDCVLLLFCLCLLWFL